MQSDVKLGQDATLTFKRSLYPNKMKSAWTEVVYNILVGCTIDILNTLGF